jgi:ankyrin repeat protein
MKDSSIELKHAFNELKRIDPELSTEYEATLNKRGVAQRTRLILDILDRLPVTFPPELKNDLFEPVRSYIITEKQVVTNLIKEHGSKQTEGSANKLFDVSTQVGGRYRSSLSSRKRDKNASFMSSVRDAGRAELVNEREQNNLLKAIFEQDFLEEQKAIKDNESSLRRKSKKRSSSFVEAVENSEELESKKNNRRKIKRVSFSEAPEDSNNISENKRAAIRIALKKDDYRPIRHLINNGVNPNIKDSNGDNLLHRAIKAKKSNITDYLLRLSSVDFDAINYRNETSLTLLVKSYDMPNAIEYMRKIIYLGKHKNVIDIDGNTPLHHLAIIWEREDGVRGRNSFELFQIKELLVKHVDIDTKNKEGQTAFEISPELENVVSISSPISSRGYVEKVSASRGSRKDIPDF